MSLTYNKTEIKDFISLIKIDDEYMPLLKQHNWRMVKDRQDNYRIMYRETTGKRKTHDILSYLGFNLKCSEQIIHLNRDPLDLRVNNLLIIKKRGKERLSEIIVDPEDQHILNDRSWYVSKVGYVAHSVKIERRTIYLHRYILNAPEQFQVDHINGNKMDNRKSNLRLCDFFGNARNRSKNRHDSLSKYKGVSKMPEKHRRKLWRVQIHLAGKNTSIGYFDNEIDAAKKYDEMALKHFGEFAWLNFREGKL